MDDLQRFRPVYPGIMLPDEDGVWIDRRHVATRIEALTADLAAAEAKLAQAAEVLKKIASCEMRFEGDVVSISRAFLTEIQSNKETDHG